VLLRDTPWPSISLLQARLDALHAGAPANRALLSPKSAASGGTYFGAKPELGSAGEQALRRQKQ